MANYAFGAGGFKLGERVEILTTGQRGILISETVHISGCNTYLILLPTVLKEGKMQMTNRDHLILRKLEQNESLFDAAKQLTNDNSFSPKGVDVNAEWIREAIREQKEFITEIDDAVGVEEIAIEPGAEVYNKTCGRIMVVTYITREIFSKELLYGAVHMVDDREVVSMGNMYTFVPLVQKLNVPAPDKTGPIFEDGRNSIISRIGFSIDAFVA